MNGNWLTLRGQKARRTIAHWFPLEDDRSLCNAVELESSAKPLTLEARDELGDAAYCKNCRKEIVRGMRPEDAKERERALAALNTDLSTMHARTRTPEFDDPYTRAVWKEHHDQE